MTKLNLAKFWITPGFPENFCHKVSYFALIFRLFLFLAISSAIFLVFSVQTYRYLFILYVENKFQDVHSLIFLNNIKY